MKSGDVVQKLEQDISALVLQAITTLKEDHNLLLTEVNVKLMGHYQGSMSRPDMVMLVGVTASVCLPGIHPQYGTSKKSPDINL